MALIVFFFLLMLFTPLVFQGPRALLLGLILLSTFRLRKPLKLNKEIGFMCFITLIASILSIVNGAVRNNPFVFSSVGLYVGWPVLFMYFMMRCEKMDVIIKLLKTIVYGGLVVAAFNFLMIVNSYILHIGFLERIGMLLNMQFNIQDGFAEYFSPSGNHLPYILYFCVTLLLLKPEVLTIKKQILIICIFLSVIDILLSNRRAMWIVILLLPFVLLLLFSLLHYNKRVILKIVSLGIVSAIMLSVVIMVFLDIESLIEEFNSSFDMTGDDSNLERTLQGRSLWKDFLDNPIIGAGLGHVSGYIRSGATYELTYNAILASHGALGFMLYTIAIIWTYVKSIKLSNKNIFYASILAPQIMGLFALLFISATNPYIGTFDFVWTIFLPVITINTIWKEKQNVKV